MGQSDLLKRVNYGVLVLFLVILAIVKERSCEEEEDDEEDEESAGRNKAMLERDV